MRIFVSHSSRDIALVAPLEAQAKAMAIEVYLHEHDAQPGTALATKLLAALAGCDALLVLITKNSIGSPYVHQEIGAALGRGIPIIPLVENEIPGEQLAMLQGIEYIEYDPFDTESALRQLTVHLHRTQITRLQQQAASTEAAAAQAKTAVVLLAILLVVLVGLCVVAG